MEGCLYHLWSLHPSASRAETVLQLVVPKKWRAELLTNEHDKAGHFGAVATYDQLRQIVWWPSMFADVKSYVDSCVTCESVKKPIGKLPMVMWMPVKFNQRVTIDPAGPFLVT